MNIIKQLCIILCLSFSVSTIAQISAVTSTGDEVTLYEDGTWQYVGAAPTIENIEFNETKFTGAKELNFEVKSQINNSFLQLNTKKWKFNKSMINPDAEYEFTLKGKDLYAMMITEGIEIGMENLADIAYSNARGFSPDCTIETKEYREVNGHKVLFLEMHGTSQGIKFCYLGYYFSNETGSTQLVAYTAANLLDKYKEDIDTFLNGVMFKK